MIIFCKDRLWITVYDGDLRGYVHYDYVTKHLEKIPKSSLYLSYQVYIDKLLIRYPDEKPQDFNFNNRTTCYQFYSKNITYPQVTYLLNDIERAYIATDKNANLTDTIKSYIKLELVDSSNFSEVSNQYKIDTTFQPNKSRNEKYLAGFYLPINNGIDSIGIFDQEYEVHIYKRYIGELKYSNQYLISEDYEGSIFYTIDKMTGEKKPHYGGYISPNNQYSVSLGIHYTFDGDDAATVSINLKDAGKALKNGTKSLSMAFKSWIPDLETNSAYWISNNELMIRCFPRDNYRYLQNPNYQYIKLTILE